MNFISILFLSLSLFNQNVDSLSGINDTEAATKYYLKILDKVSKMESANWNYLKSLVNNPVNSHVRKTALIKKIDRVIRDIHKVGPYNQDNELRGSYLYYLKVKREALAQNLPVLANISQIEAESYDFFEATTKADSVIAEKLDFAYERALNSERNFRSNYNLTVNKKVSKKSLKIKSAEEALEYADQLEALIFNYYVHKIYINRSYNNFDIVALQQNINNMNSYLEDASQKCNEIDAFQGSATLKNMTQKVISQFMIESEPNSKKIMDLYFYMDDKMKSIKKAKGDRFQKLSLKNQLKEINKQLEFDKEYNSLVEDYAKISKGSISKIQDWFMEVYRFKTKFIIKL